MQFDKDKFKKVIHYICARSESTKLGATKLNKVLWFSDIANYLSYGESITGEKYIKRQFGPVPSNVLVALSELEQEKKIIIRSCNHYGHDKKEFVYITQPDISDLSGTEVDLINQTIDLVCNNHTAKSISNLTHNRVWELASIGEEIPYETALASERGEINESDIEWASQVLAEAA